MSKETVMYKLHVPFRWVSAFPLYFHTHPRGEVAGKEVWVTRGLEEIIKYLNNIDFKMTKTLKDKTTEISKSEWPTGVCVLENKDGTHELDETHKSLKRLFSTVIAGDKSLRSDFLLFPDNMPRNMFLFWSIQGDINFQMCMQRLKKYDDVLFRVMMKYTIHLMQDMGIDEKQNGIDKARQNIEDCDPFIDTPLYDFLNINCSFQLVYYTPHHGNLISHIDNILPVSLPGDKTHVARRTGPIYTMSLFKDTKYMDLFPVWQPNNESDQSAEAAYRLATHFGQITKLSEDARYRFSHGIPNGSKTEGFTVAWKWEEQNPRTLEKWNQVIFIHENAHDIEYERERTDGRRHGARRLQDLTSTEKLLPNTEVETLNSMLVQLRHIQI